jgi:hypothetical protein
MKRRRLLAACAGLVVLGAAPCLAGGAGPLPIGRAYGTVEVKRLDKPGRKWEAYRPGMILGYDYQLRTRSGSWVHLDREFCLDANSVIQVESAADYGIIVLKGKVSKQDGKDGPGVFREFDTIRGIVRR